MVAQLEVGGIDCFIGPEPFNQRAFQSGAGRIFLPTRQLWDPTPAARWPWPRTGFRRIPTPSTGSSPRSPGPPPSSTIRPGTGNLPRSSPREKYLNQQVGLLAPALAGHYVNWDDEEITDPEMMSFGDPTDPTAITWMAAQIARWDLSSATSLPLDDTAIIAAATSVLPAGVPRQGQPVRINGRLFDPAHPTSNYPRN